MGPLDAEQFPQFFCPLHLENFHGKFQYLERNHHLSSVRKIKFHILPTSFDYTPETSVCLTTKEVIRPATIPYQVNTQQKNVESLYQAEAEPLLACHQKMVLSKCLDLSVY